MTANESEADETEATAEQTASETPTITGGDSLLLRPTAGNQVVLQASDETDVLVVDSPSRDVTVPNGGMTAGTYTVEYASEYPQSPRQADAFAFPALAQHPAADNPVLQRGDFVLSTGDTVNTVADPFVVREGATFYMFVEAKQGSDQEIHCATSPDGIAWTHRDVVLTGGVLSYPAVLKHDGTWYMLPMDANSTDLTVYRGDPFPDTWTEDTTITMPTNESHDATVFRSGDYWWLYWQDADGAGNSVVRLAYESSFPADGWTEHPDSPIRSAGTDERPGGRPFVHEDYVDLPFQAVVDGVYGSELRLYRATSLTPDDYADAELAASPVLRGTGAGSAKYGTWNAVRMHHVDYVLGAKEQIAMAFVDGGRPDGSWSIGVYSPTDKVPVGAELSLSSRQTVGANTTETVALDQTVLDTHGRHDAGNYTWTAPRSGWFRICAQFGVQWDPSTDGRVTLDLVDTDSGERIVRTNTTGNAAATYQSLALRPRLVHLARGQAVHVDVWNTLDGSIDILSGTDQSALVVERVRLPG